MIRCPGSTHIFISLKSFADTMLWRSFCQGAFRLFSDFASFGTTCKHKAHAEVCPVMGFGQCRRNKTSDEGKLVALGAH